MSQITVIPHLACRNAPEAYEFYQKAFGAQPGYIQQGPDGRVMHASLDFGGSLVYLVDEFPEYGGHGPESLGGSPVTIHLSVENAAPIYERAVEAGCTVVMPIQDMFWGDRYGMIKDPYGHNWSIAHKVRDVSQEELAKAIAEMDPNCGPESGQQA